MEMKYIYMIIVAVIIIAIIAYMYFTGGFSGAVDTKSK
jgi:hypothetical protein